MSRLASDFNQNDLARILSAMDRKAEEISGLPAAERPLLGDISNTVRQRVEKELFLAPGELDKARHALMQRQGGSGARASDSSEVDSLRSALMEAAGGGPNRQVIMNGVEQELPDRTEQQQIALDAMEDLDGLSPLVRAGVIDSGAVRSMLTQSVTDASSEHRNMRKAAQELGQMRKLYEGGRITSQQALGAVNQLKSVYGENVLLKLPEYREFAGVESHVQQEKEQMQQGYADRMGIPREAVTWDERGNVPTPNLDYFGIQDKKWQIKSRRVQGLVSHANAIAKQRENAVKLINTVAAQKGDTSRLMKQYYQLVADFDLAEQAIRDELDTGGTTPTQSDPVQEDTLEQAVQQKAPSLQATVQYPTFATREEATAAARAGNIPGGQVIMVGGRKARWNGSSFVRVE